MIPIFMSGPKSLHSLVQVRRKVRKAVEAAQQSKRPFEPCYPESTSADTSMCVKPVFVIDTAQAAHEVAETFGTWEGDPPIIDRVARVHELQALRA